jgi:ferredoxin-NADP reductase/ferredoxin/truncated hemoglobin YjbI
MPSAPALIEYEGTTYTAKPHETILQALLRQGADLRHSCGKGSCHTCVLRVAQGQVHWTSDVPLAFAASDRILPCVCEPLGHVVIARIDDAVPTTATVVQRRVLAPDVLELGFAPARAFVFQAGQHVELIAPDGLVRPYSIASLPGEDGCFRIHVRRIAGGRMSGWLFDAAEPGLRVAMRGPFGDCCHHAAPHDAPLLLLATGTGVGALAALAQSALAAGHRGPIALYHGARRRTDLYLDATLRALERATPFFHYFPCISREEPRTGERAGHCVDLAFDAPHEDWHDTHVFACGLPAMTADARRSAIAAGVARGAIHVDAYRFAQTSMPDDARKIDRVQADPELWHALEHGPGLTRILDDFYARVFADARLAPFFQGLTPTQVATRQYAFLADLIAGRREFFGLNPFNAHHWMVISDALFDHRETLFAQVLADHGLAPHLIRRFAALHELFRPEIVKTAPRGFVSDGIEQPLHDTSLQRLDIATVCDGCRQEIPAGALSRYRHRLGTLHCAACANIAIP